MISLWCNIFTNDPSHPLAIFEKHWVATKARNGNSAYIFF